jgi:hypothetical protein
MSSVSIVTRPQYAHMANRPQNTDAPVYTLAEGKTLVWETMIMELMFV